MILDPSPFREKGSSLIHPSVEMIKPLLKWLLLPAVSGILAWGVISYWLAEPARLLPASSPKGFEIIAHRGGRGIAPENTLFAFEKADRLGVDVLEFDIHLARDGHPVVIHDATLNRTTNGKGKIREYDLNELQTFDAAYYFSPEAKYNNSRDKSVYDEIEKDPHLLLPLRAKGITIPSLADVFERFPSKRMVIELKSESAEIVEPFCRMIHQFNKQDQLIVGSFHGDLLKHFRKVCPDVATSAGPREGTLFVLFTKPGLAGIITPQYQALQIPPRLSLNLIGDQPVVYEVNTPFVKTAHKRRLLVQVWTVNDGETMKAMIRAGVDGIMTDYPDRLLKVLEK